MKKNVENIYNIKKAKAKIKILTIAMYVFAALTILMVFSSLYFCEMKVYQRTKDEQGQEEIKLMIFGNYDENYEYDEDDNIKKITFANMAFGFNIDEENLGLIPVAQDAKFLLIFLAQVIAYVFIFTNFGSNKKINFILSIVGSVLLLSVAIISVIFFNNYAKDLEMACNFGIEAFRQAYPDKNIISTTAANYASGVNVSISPVVGISTAFMIVSSGICLYTGLLKKSIDSMEKENAK